MKTLAGRGFDLAFSDSGGQGPLVLLLHETAASSAIWEPLTGMLESHRRVVAPDRRGWGASTAPDPYLQTTIEEQAEDAINLLEELGARDSVIVGSGLGGVAALDIGMRRPDLAAALVVIEPPLFGFLPEATEGLSRDGSMITEAFREGGATAGADLYLSGELTTLAAGAERIPPPISAVARDRPGSLFAELGAVPSWSIPFAAMRESDVPTVIVSGVSTPPLVARAGELLAERLEFSIGEALPSDGLPHWEGAAALAELIGRLGTG